MVSRRKKTAWSPAAGLSVFRTAAFKTEFPASRNRCSELGANICAGHLLSQNGNILLLMKPKVIKTESECAAVLARIEKLMDARPNTPQGDELELLSLLVHDYEEKVFPMDKPDPVAAIRFRMEQQGLQPRDLVPFLGSRSRVSEVLSGRRHLSLKMIRALVGGLGIPADVLLGHLENA